MHTQCCDTSAEPAPKVQWVRNKDVLYLQCTIQTVEVLRVPFWDEETQKNINNKPSIICLRPYGIQYPRTVAMSSGLLDPKLPSNGSGA